MKALMCFMYELAPPVWQRLVCCLNRTLLAMAEVPLRACRLAFLSFLLALTLYLQSKWPNGSCWMNCVNCLTCVGLVLAAGFQYTELLPLARSSCYCVCFICKTTLRHQNKPCICVRCRLCDSF